MITLLKCETCGGSNFVKHPNIDEFLVCENCGNQYMTEVKDIKDNLPFDLKVKISGNHNKFKVNNSIITGNYNKIDGNYNISIGNHNTLKGNNNIAKGNYNKTL